MRPEKVGEVGYCDEGEHDGSYPAASLFFDLNPDAGGSRQRADAGRRSRRFTRHLSRAHRHFLAGRTDRWQASMDRRLERSGTDRRCYRSGESISRVPGPADGFRAHGGGLQPDTRPPPGAREIRDRHAMTDTANLCTSIKNCLFTLLGYELLEDLDDFVPPRQ